MAILIITDASEDTLAHYDQVIKQLEAAGHGQPPGRQFHVAAEKGTGYVVTDVWESQEAFDRFFQILEPLLQQGGSRPEQGSMQILPVHNVIKGA
jgi:heme-degrading monooxygenase HmoA